MHLGEAARWRPLPLIEVLVPHGEGAVPVNRAVAVVVEPVPARDVRPSRGGLFGPVDAGMLSVAVPRAGGPAVAVLIESGILVDEAVAVVVDQIARLRGAGMDGSHGIV